MGIGGLGNLVFINKVVGLVNPAMIRGGRVIPINLKVCDPRGSGKRRNFSFSFLCLEKGAVLVDA